ncbi:hypothetical protein GLAREA_11834 [Glarea lozoyensis ATCC 20868]|uniref:Uncharacterized protein n=1 Tax=Glarea lozoyensis (strain ATCC 20868 / MF5171) TaxID=1116229 RepID=S3DF30_GLAL2|nr:uncharacterized protein GLAREA_11834 [Glarea lozoyensis ATCC 20868]EPE25253.1 hypothetical protein GLAREA_11834 [Glarea lozoyensis ATCC 20868]
MDGFQVAGGNLRPRTETTEASEVVLANFHTTPVLTFGDQSTAANMVNKPVIPDAWDDDWESQADKEEGGVAIATSADVVKVTRAERLAQHAETNKKIWDSAA